MTFNRSHLGMHVVTRAHCITIKIFSGASLFLPSLAQPLILWNVSFSFCLIAHWFFSPN